MVKYKFAYDSQENIIALQNAKKKDKYKCLGCGQEMIYVGGKKKAPHFRHVVEERNCSNETYLHKLAKNKFLQTYQDCLINNKPFKIKFSTYPACNFYKTDFLTTCELPTKIQELDLTEEFKKIYLECKESAFIPDVLLESDDQEKIFFEVAVTHFSSKAKIQSDYRIIEFFIKSEDDIKKIESEILEESYEIKFINFNSQPSNHCNGKCSKGIIPYSSEKLLYNIFVVYKNSECSFINKISLESLTFLMPQILHFEYTTPEKYGYLDSLYTNKVVERYYANLM
jgi:hypothetical protein